MRILAAVGVKPRRTVRVALSSGEEQDEFGSRRYVNAHFGTVGLSTRPEELEVAESVREKVGPLTLKPEHSLISGYFNLDNGGGKILGIYAENNAAIVPIFEQWIAPLRDLGDHASASPPDLKQAAIVEAIFLYNAAMRGPMLPRKPLPHFCLVRAVTEIPGLSTLI